MPTGSCRSAGLDENGDLPIGGADLQSDKICIDLPEALSDIPNRRIV